MRLLATVIGIVLCYSHQACHFLHYLCEITHGNNGIHIYLSDLIKNISGLTDLPKKSHGSVDLHTPIQPPLITTKKNRTVGNCFEPP